MSVLMNQARTRVPRFAEAAVVRARLTVVPRVPGRRAARVPFVTLVSLLLVGGVAGLLFFNTSMQQASFTATALEQKAQLLDAREQSLTMQLDRLRDPQRVALLAKDLGMVPQAAPAFIRLSDGRVLGKPTPATVQDSVRVTPFPTRKPKNLRPRPVVVELDPGAVADGPVADGAAGDAVADTAASGAPSAVVGGATGTKRSHDRHR